MSSSTAPVLGNSSAHELIPDTFRNMSEANKVLREVQWVPKSQVVPTTDQEKCLVVRRLVAAMAYQLPVVIDVQELHAKAWAIIV